MATCQVSLSVTVKITGQPLIVIISVYTTEIIRPAYRSPSAHTVSQQHQIVGSINVATCQISLSVTVEITAQPLVIVITADSPELVRTTYRIPTALTISQQYQIVFTVDMATRKIGQPITVKVTA